MPKILEKMEFISVALNTSLVYSYCFQISGILNCYKQCMITNV